MATAKFEKVGECVSVEQLLATGMQEQTNLGYALFGAGEYKRGQLVKLTAGIAGEYDSEEVLAAALRFAIVKDDFTVDAKVTGEEKHLVYLTGSFYRDTVERVTGKTVSLAHELEMNAEGLWLSNLHL